MTQQVRSFPRNEKSQSAICLYTRQPINMGTTTPPEQQNGRLFPHQNAQLQTLTPHGARVLALLRDRHASFTTLPGSLIQSAKASSDLTSKSSKRLDRASRFETSRSMSQTSVCLSRAAFEAAAWSCSVNRCLSTSPGSI